MTLATEDFRYVADFVQKKAAIVLETGKEYLVETRLAPVARKAGIASVADLVKELRRQPASPLHTSVIEAMTTNETHFFRDVHPWETLRKEILPPLIEARAVTRQLTVWCAASSSGQEPYTIAMILRDHFPQLAGWRIRILATDLSSEMITRTKAGRYSQLEVNRGLPAPLLVRWFKKVGEDWEVSPELRKLVEATEMNLATPWPPGPTADLIFLRNVLIYFDVPTRKSILERAARRLAPDGALFLGATETTLNVTNAFVRMTGTQTSLYRPAA